MGIGRCVRRYEEVCLYLLLFTWCAMAMHLYDGPTFPWTGTRGMRRSVYLLLFTLCAMAMRLYKLKDPPSPGLAPSSSTGPTRGMVPTIRLHEDGEVEATLMYK
jgi:hypothetical protein